jgi:hypothetical protein
MQNPSQKINPLIGLMRQPKLYISLPSRGQYWPEDSLTVTPNGEYPIYSMTARDEIMLKTPDALLNGQAVVSMLESCVPNITNGWNCPQIDLDVLLIAIRLATYGESMDTSVTVNGCQGTYSVNLRFLLDNLSNTITWDERIEINETTVIYVKPLSYQHVSKASAESFELQRIINLVNNDSLEEEKKVEMFKKSFNRLTQLNLDIVADSIYKIDTAGGSVTDVDFIKEFVYKCDRELFNTVKSHLDSLQELNTIKPIKVRATQEMIDSGSAEEIEAPIVFDPASFFA